MSASSVPSPAPPPLPINLQKTVSSKSEPAKPTSTFTPTEALWASNYPELQRACYFGHVCLQDVPKECKWKNIDSILQEGPTCGLTALSMIFTGDPCIKVLQKEAVANGFSNNGEMFSAANLLELLQKHLMKSLSCRNSKTYLFSGLLDCDEIKQELKLGSLLLVPYDPDVNHSPALLKGHKAHWALIIGYLVTKNDEYFVLARHGKSRYLAAWSLKALSDSNSNLHEFAQPKDHPNEVFLLPDGGIAGANGLNQKCIVIQKTEFEQIKS